MQPENLDDVRTYTTMRPSPPSPSSLSSVLHQSQQASKAQV